jgi:hypothetical protein
MLDRGTTIGYPIGSAETAMGLSGGGTRMIIVIMR